MQDGAGRVFLADCPARLAVEIISDKWAVLVLHGLSREPRRHGELIDLIGGISRKVLTQTLRRLEEYGLVEHRASSGGRPADYRLTDLGETLAGPIEALTTWARDHGPSVVEFQLGAGTGAEAVTGGQATA